MLGSNGQPSIVSPSRREHGGSTPEDALHHHWQGPSQQRKHVDDLPDDILYLIFVQSLNELLCDEKWHCHNSESEDYHLWPLTISKVCRKWRAFALNNPFIWSHINLNLSERGLAAPAPPEPGSKLQDRVNAFIERSAAQPLIVAWNRGRIFESQQTFGEVKELERMKDCFISTVQSRRVHYLSIIDSAHHLDDLPMIDSDQFPSGLKGFHYADIRVRPRRKEDSWNIFLNPDPFLWPCPTHLQSLSLGGEGIAAPV